MVTHFALCASTACNSDICNGMLHTTVKEKVTCKNCLKILKNKSSFKEYKGICEDTIMDDAEEAEYYY